MAVRPLLILATFGGALAVGCDAPATSTTSGAATSAAAATVATARTSAASAAPPSTPAPSASASASPSTPPKRSVAELKADALAHRADYDGKPLSVDGYFVKREQVQVGTGEHPRYVFHNALVADSADPAAHADKNNLLRCELGENFPAFEALAPVTIQGTAQVDSTTVLYDKNELRLERCTIKRRAP